MNASVPGWFTLLLIYLCVVGAYGLGFIRTCLWASMPAYVPFLYFFMIGTTLYSVHAAGHRRNIWPRWYQAHVMGHHVYGYPSKQFLRPSYRDHTEDPYMINPLLYVTCALLTSFAFFAAVPGLWHQPKAQSALMILALVGATLEDRLHERIHAFVTQPGTLARYIQVCHWVHHSGDHRSNYAVLALFFDRLFGTLQYSEKHAHEFQQYLLVRSRR